ncbi:LamG-like jellyroll fold domain-containing protein [Planctomycetota bacterium]
MLSRQDLIHASTPFDDVEDPAGPVAYTGPINVDDFPVWIGANAERPGRGFIGRIDEVLVYDQVLTPTEIFDLATLAGNAVSRQPIPR